MMKNEDKRIKDIRRRMDDYSEPLPEGLWKRLEEELPAPRVIPIWRNRWMAAAAVIMLLAVSSVTVWLVQLPTASIDKGNELARRIEEQVSVAVDGESLAEDIKENVASAPAEVSPKAVPNDVTVIAEVQPASAAVEETVLSVSETKEISQPSDVQDVYTTRMSDQDSHTEMNVSSATARSKAATDRRIMQRNRAMLAGGQNENANRRFSVGLLAGNAMISSSSSFGGITRLASAAKPQQSGVMSDGTFGGDVGSSYTEVLFPNSDVNSSTRVKHKMPVTVGASLKWNLNDNWAIETGLVYTLLSSELTSGSSSYIKEEQKLHYVGIPVKVQRSIWKSKRFNLYASAGAMVEKCVSGKVECSYVTDNTQYPVSSGIPSSGVRNQGDADASSKKENYSFDVDPLQFSVGAAVGAQVNLAKRLGLYVEPGVTYYFDDGSDIETIRKEHPFNFNLQLGLRIDLGK